MLEGFAGARSIEAIIERFAALPLGMPNRRDHIDAVALSNLCRRSGVQLGTIDAMLAQLCVRYDLTLLTKRTRPSLSRRRIARYAYGNRRCYPPKGDSSGQHPLTSHANARRRRLARAITGRGARCDAESPRRRRLRQHGGSRRSKAVSFGLTMSYQRAFGARAFSSSKISFRGFSSVGWRSTMDRISDSISSATEGQKTKSLRM